MNNFQNNDEYLACACAVVTGSDLLLGALAGHDDIGGTERLGGISIYLGGTKNPEETMDND